MSLASSKSALPKGWPALVACLLIPGISNGLFVTCFPLWVVPWISDFHAERGTVMAGFAIGNLVMGLASPFVGYCLLRIPVRLSVALGGLTLAGGFALASLAPSLWQVIALYSILMALGASFTSLLPAQSVAVGLLPEKAGTIGGLITLAISGGGMVMPGLLAGPVATLGWRSTFLIAGAIVLATVVPLGWFLLKGHGAAKLHGEGDAVGHTNKTLLGSLAFWIPLFAVVPVMFIVGTVLTNAVAIATDSGIHVETASYLVPMIALGGALGSVGLGWLADRMDYRLVFSGTAAGLIIALLSLLNPLGLLPLALAFGMVGFAGGGVIPVLSVMVVRAFGPATFPRVMGLVMPAMVLSMAVAPVFAGRVRDLTGSYNIAFIFCVGLMAAGTLAVLMFRVAPEKAAKVAIDLQG